MPIPVQKDSVAFEQQVSDAAHEREVLGSQIGQRDNEIASLGRQLEQQLAEMGRMKIAQSQLESNLQNGEEGRQGLLQETSDLTQKLEAARTRTQDLEDKLQSLARQGSEDKERATALETARFLVERGADVNAAGQYGWTALHAAAYQGMNDLIEYLVSKGAKIDQKDQFGQTPLSISLSVLTKDIGARRLQIPRRYRQETAELLLKLGASTLEKAGVVVILQRSGDLNLGKRVP